MNINKIKEKIICQLNLKHLIIHKEGDNFRIIAVGDIFEGLNPVKRQKLIYAPLMKYILNKKIHALHIKVYSSLEWKNKNIKISENN